MCRSSSVSSGLINRFLMLMTVIVCIMMTNTVQAGAQYIIRPNMGQAQEELGRYCISTSEAELHFMLKLPELDNMTYETEVDCQSIGNGRSEIHNCRVIKPLLTTLHIMRRDASNLTREELTRIYALVTSFDIKRDNRSRDARSILTTVGSMIGNVFGLATDEKLSHVEKVVKQIYDVTFRAANTLEASGSKLSKVILTQNDRLDTMHRLLETEHNATAVLFREFSAVSLNFDLSHMIISQALKFVMTYIRALQSITELSDSLHQLLRGRLSDELISREILATELKALKRELHGLHICHDDIAFYYQYASVKAFRSEGTLVITVGVPLSYFSEGFTAIRILSLPMPSHIDSSTNYMQLYLERNIFLYSDTHGVYAELNESPDRATGIVNMRGKSFVTLNEAATCAAAIIKKNIDQQRALCEYRLHSGNPLQQLFRVDQTHVFVAGTNVVQLQCGRQDGVEMEIKQIAAVLRVDCNCDIRINNNLFLPSQSVNCSQRFQIPRTLYFSNLPLLKSLFQHDAIDQLTVNALHEKPIGVELPSLQMSEIESDLDFDKKRSINLRELTRSLTNSTKVYSSLSSYVFDKLVTQTVTADDDTIFSWTSWLAILSTALAFLELLFCCYLALRLKAICAVLLIASNKAGTAHLQLLDEQQQPQQQEPRRVQWEVLRLTPKPMTTTAGSDSESKLLLPAYKEIVNVVDEHISADAMNMILLLSVMVFGGLLVYKAYMSRKIYFPLTEIYFEVASKLGSVTIFWQELPHVHGCYKIKRPNPAIANLRSERYHGIPCARLYCRMAFVDTETGLTIEPNKMKLIGFQDAREIKRVTKNEYYLFVIITNTQRTNFQRLKLKAPWSDMGRNVQNATAPQATTVTLTEPRGDTAAAPVETIIAPTSAVQQLLPSAFYQNRAAMVASLGLTLPAAAGHGRPINRDDRR